MNARPNLVADLRKASLPERELMNDLPGSER